jgi:hypothetical protein
MFQALQSQAIAVDNITKRKVASSRFFFKAFYLSALARVGCQFGTSSQQVIFGLQTWIPGVSDYWKKKDMRQIARSFEWIPSDLHRCRLYPK